MLSPVLFYLFVLFGRFQYCLILSYIDILPTLFFAFFDNPFWCLSNDSRYLNLFVLIKTSVEKRNNFIRYVDRKEQNPKKSVQS